jgi:hypothetical protein
VAYQPKLLAFGAFRTFWDDDEVLSPVFVNLTGTCLHLLDAPLAQIIFPIHVIISSVSIWNDLHSVCYKDFYFYVLIGKQQHQAATCHKQLTLELKYTND